MKRKLERAKRLARELVCGAVTRSIDAATLEARNSGIVVVVVVVIVVVVGPHLHSRHWLCLCDR